MHVAVSSGSSLVCPLHFRASHSPRSIRCPLLPGRRPPEAGCEGDACWFMVSVPSPPTQLAVSSFDRSGRRAHRDQIQALPRWGWLRGSLRLMGN
jgi:hypothetical protein